MVDIPILGKIDPNTAGVSALLWVIVIFIIIFIIRYYWPFYTKVKWPREQEQLERLRVAEIEIEKSRNDVLSSIKENLIRLTTLQEATFRALGEHDLYTKEIWQDLAPLVMSLRNSGTKNASYVKITDEGK